MAPSNDILHLVRWLNSCQKSDLEFILKNLNPRAIHNLCEIFKNVEYNTLKLSGKSRRDINSVMIKNKNSCRLISSDKTPLHKRRLHLKKQVGSGLISLILSALAPILLQLFNVK